MSRSFIDRLALSRAELDRDHLSRSRPLAELVAESHARFVILHEGRALVERGRELLLLLPEPSEPGTLLDESAGPAIYLGRTIRAAADVAAGAPVVAVQLHAAAASALVERLGAIGRDVDWADLRRAGRDLSTRDAGLLTEALAVANWHRAYGFSPRTGRATEPASNGWTRVDLETGREVFPRTDAAIIVGVTDAADRLLLGSNALWPADRFSLLAGFVEPGESLEAAVIREVHEESGITVSDPVYLGSQPWPFPASLMLGFRARVAEGTGIDPRPDGEELLDVRWFARDELAAAVAAGELALPGTTSIARAIIEDWYGGDLGPSTW